MKFGVVFRLILRWDALRTKVNQRRFVSIVKLCYSLMFIFIISFWIVYLAISTSQYYYQLYMCDFLEIEAENGALLTTLPGTGVEVR